VALVFQDVREDLPDALFVVDDQYVTHLLPSCLRSIKKVVPYGFLGLEPDNAIMVKDNPFDNRQAEAGAFLLGGVVRD
jgi:hypothetical protein